MVASGIVFANFASSERATVSAAWSDAKVDQVSESLWSTKTHCPGRASCRDALAFYLHEQMLYIALVSFTFAMLLFGVASGALYCLQENALVVVILDDLERNRKDSDISVEMVEKVLDGRKRDTFAFALTEEQKKKEEDAAIRLQAILRGHLARKSHSQKRKEERPACPPRQTQIHN